MDSINIHVHDQQAPLGYNVIVGKGLLTKIDSLLPLQAYSRVFIIADPTAEKLLIHTIPKLHTPPTVIVIPGGDEHKNITTIETIWRELLEHGCDRKSLLINVGGGVIGDMGGFAASTYMRGIAYVQVPTTILAQVDAAVGGKVGINFHGVKNSIGAIKQPLAVIIDIDTIKTLPDRPFIAGFGEIIKHGLIADTAYFHKVTSKKPRSFSEAELIDIIAESVIIKKHIIERDLTENAERKLVNFGHTFGHAIEAISHANDRPLMHGEAVSVGMAFEARISQKVGYLSEEDVQQIEKTLTHAELPIRYRVDDKNALFKKMYADKKNVGGKIKWTLLRRIGEGIWDQDVAIEIVEEVLAEFH